MQKRDDFSLQCSEILNWLKVRKDWGFSLSLNQISFHFSNLLLYHENFGLLSYNWWKWRPLLTVRWWRLKIALAFMLYFIPLLKKIFSFSHLEAYSLCLKSKTRFSFVICIIEFALFLRYFFDFHYSNLNLTIHFFLFPIKILFRCFDLVAKVNCVFCVDEIKRTLECMNELKRKW